MNSTPIITIGREPGSGGMLIASALSKLTGYPVYDKELITKAAQESGLHQELFENIDECSSYTTSGGLFGWRNSLMDHALTHNFISNESLFTIQSDTIRKLAEEGAAIFVGRCADYVLKHHNSLCRVFISAPIEHRVLRIAERLQISEAEAKIWVEKMDKKRKNYYNYFSNSVWGDAKSYDISLNSSRWGIESCAAIIAKALQQ